MQNPDNSKELLKIITHAVHESSWFILYYSHEQPFRLGVYRYGASQSLIEKACLIDVYISFLMPLNDNVYHLEITGSKRLPDWSEEERLGKRSSSWGKAKILILGWWEEGEVFIGFDHTFHAEALESGISFQIDEETLLRAKSQSLTTHRRGKEEIAIAFIPSSFATYVELLDELHDFGRCEKDRLILEEVCAKASG